METWRRVVFDNFDLFMSGLWVSVQIWVIGFAVAIVLGMIACLLKLYVSPVRWLAELYIQFGRNTPVYVQLLWVNYVWPEVFGWPQTFFSAGWMALALQSSGYLAETFRAGIEGIPRGHVEAASAMGMSPVLTFRHVVIPQALLIMAPSIMNQFLVLAKASTLVSVIAVPDLMYHALRLTSRWFEPIEPLTFVAFLYIVIIFALSHAMKRYSDRLRARYG